MKRFASVAVAGVVSVLFATGIAMAHMAPGGMYGGAGGGPGWMHGGGAGPGWMHGGGAGPGWMGAGAGCPGYQAAATQGQGTITEDEAKALVDEYVQAYLPGFTVEKVVPFQGRRMVAYQAELKGPKGETRLLHVNPWGQVVPFGGPPRG